jgi:hypothetical protein
MICMCLHAIDCLSGMRWTSFVGAQDPMGRSLLSCMLRKIEVLLVSVPFQQQLARDGKQAASLRLFGTQCYTGQQNKPITEAKMMNLVDTHM